MKHLSAMVAIALMVGASILPHTESNAQGCSDAGFCTMGALRPGQPYSRRIKLKLRSAEISQYIGMTRFKDQIYVTTVEATVGLNSQNSIHIKLPYQATAGPLGTFGGISDLSLSYTRVLPSLIPGWQLGASVGAKIPLRQPDLTHPNGNQLPMYYQPTLGTYDLVAGASLINKHWLIAVGVQHALTASNNEFVWGPWMGTEFQDKATTYPAARQLRRGTDAMIRVEYNVRLGDKNFYTGLLPIYRFQEDIITRPDGTEVSIEGSNGLALTWVNGAGYQFSTRSGIKALAGIRLIERDTNPDGLSRKFVFSLGYEYRF